MANFKRFQIGEVLPQRYRLATVDDVVQHAHQLGSIRAGKGIDVQDFGDDYFDYYCRPLDFDKTRLKDGFIDNSRNLAWWKFGGLCVVDKLAISTPSSDAKLCPSSLTNINNDDHRVVALLYACLEEDIDEIKDLVREHGKEIILVNVHGVPCSGNALHLCAWEGKNKSLDYLLKVVDKEAAAKAVGKLDGETPLLLAALRGYVQGGLAIKTLLQFDRTQINTASKVFGSTPLAMVTLWSQNLGVCEDLLNVKEIEIDYTDQAGNTALHLVVQSSPLRGEINVAILELLLRYCGFETKGFLDRVQIEPGVLFPASDFIKYIGDSNRQVRNGRFKTMQGNKRSFVNIRNKIREAPLHHAFAGISSLPSSSHTIVLKLVAMLIWAGAKITKSDANRQTILHHVCDIKNISEVEFTIARILEACFEDSLEWLEYARMQDIGGQTALHKAAFSGNKHVVSILLSSTRNDKNEEELKKVKELVHERDFDGKTALHLAVISKDNVTDKMEIIKMLVEHAGTTEDDPERGLLLWAGAENLGRAEELCQKPAYKSEELQKYFQERTQRWDEKKILQTAFDLRRHDIIVDMFNERPGRHDIPFKGKKVLSTYEEKYRTITSDQPSSLDLLEREDITCSIATLLLNQHTGSPISIGIFGGTGMGKSSLMMQVQNKMLQIAARQAIGFSSKEEGTSKKEWKCFKTPSSRDKLRGDVIKLLKENFPEQFMQDASGNEKKNMLDKDIVEEILSKYKPQFSPILKRLAFGNKGNDYSGQPDLLTVKYNASQYEKQDEAWAGLAVDISKEMVRSCMTAGQQLRISWLYAFSKNHQLFIINLVLPIVLIVFLGGFIGWLAWKLLSIPDNPLVKKFQYGSIPLSAFLVVWFVIKNILNEVKPVSETLGSQYKSLSSMNVENLGLQNRVIADIQFLQKEIYNQTSFFWIGIAFLWKCVTYFIARDKSLESSDHFKNIPKNSTLRIIVFIDNLDRSKEELLTPLNTILSVCDMNAVIAFDKRMIHKRHGEVVLRQLIQLPIVLPDPSVRKIQNHFLKDQLLAIGPQEKTNLELDIFEDDDDIDIEQVDEKNKKIEMESLGIATSWDAHYTRAEIEMFQHLAKHTYGEFRSPREWKSLLNYHRLVRSILSHSTRWKKVSLMKGWKRQLILWLFLCWQWRKQMNGIIQNWPSLVKVPSQIKHVYKHNASRMLAQISARSSSPTQRWLDSTQEILHLCRHDGLQDQRKNHNLQCSREDRLKAMDEIYPTLRIILKSRMEQLLEECQHPGQIREMQEECKMFFGEKKIDMDYLTQMFEIDETPEDKRKKRIRAWNSIENLHRMIATLKKGRCDVPMSTILNFQEFRFNCKSGYLKLFVPKE